MTVTRKLSMGGLKGGVAALRNEHLSLHLFQSTRLALLARTSEAFQTLAELDGCTEALARAMPIHARAGWRVVIDMRQAPVRVHPALDPGFERLRRETHTGFARVAVVTSTLLGRIRAQRLSNVSNIPQCIVGSMEEALAFVNEP